MKKRSNSSGRAWVMIQALAVYSWLTILSPLSVTDTYYSVYLLCGVVGVLCLLDNYKNNALWGRGQRWGIWFFALLFAGAAVLGNYELFVPLSVLQNLFDVVCCLAGGFVIGCQVLLWMLKRLPFRGDETARLHPGRVFWAVFLSVAAIDLGYLFLVRYPGVLTTDSFSTIGQILGDAPYNNVMPYWHTVTAELFVDLGMGLFGDINAGVALFHSVQILFVASAFGYALCTMYQIGVPWAVMGLVYGIYAFLPVNIVYSITLWKDIPFAASGLLLVTALYRLLKNTGKCRWLNYLALSVGILGFSLLRTNGWYAFVVVTALMALLLRKGNRPVLILMVVLLVVTWAMLGPLLDHLTVEEIDYVEAFAVPMQQVARVVVNERPLSPGETDLLSQMFFLDRVKELYDPQIVDPVKFYTFRGENLPYLLEHWQDYLALYLKLAVQYPGDFLTAWVDLTRGYWNGGYFYWTYTLNLGENPYGIYQTPGENLLARGFGALFRYLEKPEMLQFLTSIGLHTWILVACCVVATMQKRQEGVLAVPILVLIVGLWLGTPVYAEYRYAYPMMLTVPLILTTTLYGKDER